MFWQSLVRTWLAGQATEKVAQAAAQAARQRAAAQSTEPGPPPRADIGLIFALAIEAGGFVDLLSGVTTTRANGLTIRQGSYQGRQVVLAESGVGADAAREAAERLLAGHAPRLVISTGFAGGCAPGSARGDLVVAREVADLAGQVLAVDSSRALAALSGAPGVHAGRFLTVPAIVSQPAEKQSLGVAHGALALEMESFAVAQVCAGRVPFLAIRVCSDGRDDVLSDDLDQVARQRSTAGQWGAAAGAIFRRPGSIKDMLALKEQALVASDKLAQHLARLIVALIPAPPPSG